MRPRPVLLGCARLRPRAGRRRQPGRKLNARGETLHTPSRPTGGGGWARDVTCHTECTLKQGALERGAHRFPKPGRWLLSPSQGRTADQAFGRVRRVRVVVWGARGAGGGGSPARGARTREAQPPALGKSITGEQRSQPRWLPRRHTDLSRPARKQQYGRAGGGFAGSRLGKCGWMLKDSEGWARGGSEARGVWAGREGGQPAGACAQGAWAARGLRGWRLWHNPSLAPPPSPRPLPGRSRAQNTAEPIKPSSPSGTVTGPPSFSLSSLPHFPKKKNQLSFHLQQPPNSFSNPQQPLGLQAIS